MAKSDELVKYITQQVVTYIETPPEVRKQKREDRRVQKKSVPWTARWFGMLPMALELLFKKKSGDSLMNKERPEEAKSRGRFDESIG